MLRRFASVVAVGAMALTSYGVMAAAPAAADPQPNKIVVTKVVVGENKGVGYTVVVDCKDIDDGGLRSLFNGNGSEELHFPPDGGDPQDLEVFDGKECTIIETHNGGASFTTVESDQDGNTCTFPRNDTITAGGPGAGAAPLPDEPKTCEVTVTNTFEEPEPVVGPAGPPGPPGPPGEAAAAQAVAARPRFTG
jgi:Domain of unknown function (DUF5979)